MMKDASSSIWFGKNSKDYYNRYCPHQGILGGIPERLIKNQKIEQNLSKMNCDGDF